MSYLKCFEARPPARLLPPSHSTPGMLTGAAGLQALHPGPLYRLVNSRQQAISGGSMPGAHIGGQNPLAGLLAEEYRWKLHSSRAHSCAALEAKLAALQHAKVRGLGARPSG